MTAPYVATDADLDAIAAEHATRTDLLALRTDALNRTITRAERAETELAEARAESERWQEKAQEAGGAYGEANSKHHAELDRADRLERMADTLAGKAVDLEDRARAAEAELAALRGRIQALADEWNESTATGHPDCHYDEDCAGCCADDLRTLLVPVDAPTPATDTPDTTTEQESAR